VFQDLNSVSAWTQAIVQIPSTSSTLQFAFEGVDDWGRANVLDDIRVDVPGGSIICPQVTSVSSANPDCNSVDLTWVSGGTAGSIIEYGPSGFTPGTGSFTGTVNSPYTLSGLAPNTAYDIYIADVCGVSDTGAYNGPNAASTNANGVATANFSYSNNPLSIFDYTFDASSSTGSIQNYVWDFGDGTVGNGVNPSHTYTNAGAYTVELILVSDCGNDTLTQTIADVSTIEYRPDGLSIYPNPAQESLWIKLPSKEQASLSLRDASGRVVGSWSQSFEADQETEIELGNLAEGVYFLEIHSASIQYQERILIK